MSEAPGARRQERRNPPIRLGAVVVSPCYEIRVLGILPAAALLDFDLLIASVEPAETVLRGPLQDQAALLGLLARFEIFGAEVLEVRRLCRLIPPGGAGRPG